VLRLPEGMQMGDVPPPGSGLERNHVYDIAVIGAGPAGLGAALRGRDLGLDVAVIERLPSPKRSHHPCGGVWFCPRDAYTCMDRGEGFYLKELDLEIPPGVVIERVQNFFLAGSSGFRTLRSRRSGSGFRLIDKDRFVAHLSNVAENRGATIAYNTRALSVEACAEGRQITMEGGVTVTARVVISAEGISGRMAEQAGVPVNHSILGWGYGPMIQLPGSVEPGHEAGFYIDKINQATTGKGGVLAAYASSGPVSRHLFYSQMHPQKSRMADQELTKLAEHFFSKCDEKSFLPDLPQHMDGAAVDGARYLVRDIPPRFVGRAFIATGDAIATCAMITNCMAIKTGDLAAVAAAEAIQKGDTSAEALSRFEDKVRRLRSFQGMSWMNNILFRAPLELERDQMNTLFRSLRRLALGDVMGGNFRAMLRFLLLNLPMLVTKPHIRRYLMP
jgi:flavin-dependent dehydrogenase